MHDVKRRRAAFTLVEILVVIAIIAILAALATWGVFAMIGAQQRRNTHTTMNVLNTILLARWNAVIEEAKKEQPSPQVAALAGGDPERAKVIWIKVRLVEAFPMRYEEVPPPSRPVGYTGPFTIVEMYIPNNRRKAHVEKYYATVGGLTAGAPGESSACLLMALRTQGDGSKLDDQIKHAIGASDGTNQINVLNDGWGRPLAFYRFAWKDINLQNATPGGAATRFADPVDSYGKLITGQWYNSPIIPPATMSVRQMYEAQFHWVADPQLPAPPPLQPAPARALYVMPILVSAGRDGRLDLALDSSRNGYDLSASGTGSADNVFSFQLRGD